MASTHPVQPAPFAGPDDVILDALRTAVTYMVSDDRAPDLTQRQLGTLLLLGCTARPQTIRGIAAALSVQRPVATRVVDVLEDEGLALRLPDPTDRRSVHVVATAKGQDFLASLAARMRAPTAERGKAWG